jgi:hypothetical protein
MKYMQQNNTVKTLKYRIKKFSRQEIKEEAIRCLQQQDRVPVQVRQVYLHVSLK